MKKSTKIIIWIAAVAIVGLGATYFARNRPADGATEDTGIWVETWLSMDYVDVLRRTLSPMTANDSADVPRMDVYKSETAWNWYCGDFHEGGGCNMTCNLDEYPGHREIAFRSEWAQGEIVARGIMTHADTLLLESHDTDLPLTGKYVKATPNLEAFVNGLLLSGKYVSQYDDTCVFDDSGVAKWGNVAFEYEVVLDPIIACDVFCLPQGCRDVFGWLPYYHFEWKKDKLYICDTYGVPTCDSLTSYKEPLLILTPVRK